MTEGRAKDWRAAFRAILGGKAPGEKLKRLLAEGKKTPTLLKDAAGISAGPVPFHSGSLLDHMARCMNETAGDPLAVWMALCHDAGKLTTPRDMLPHHYNHESRGEILARQWARELKLDEHWGEAGAMCSRLHMKAGKFMLLRPGKKLTLLEEVDASGCGAQFLRVINADTKTRLGDWLAFLCKIRAEAQARGMERDQQILLIKDINIHLLTQASTAQADAGSGG